MIRQRTLIALIFSVVLHASIIILLLFGHQLFPRTQQVIPSSTPMEVVSVDQEQVDDELKRLKMQEENKRKAEQARHQELLKEEKKLKASRKKEQKRKDKIKKEAEKITQQKKKAEKKLLALKKKQEKEAKKAQEAEAERKRIEEQAEVERKKIAEEEEKRVRKKEAQVALKNQLEQETEERQKVQNQKIIDRLVGDIRKKVTLNFNRTGLASNLSCVIKVRLIPSGELIDVILLQSSGNEIFDRRAVNAVQKASPFPVPADTELFERLGLREITFPFRLEK